MEKIEIKGNNEYSFIDKHGKVIFKTVCFTKDEAINRADCNGIKGNEYVKVKRRKVKDGN